MRSEGQVELFGQTDNRFFAAAPGKQACIERQVDFQNFIGRGDKMQAAGRDVEERFDNRPFP